MARTITMLFALLLFAALFAAGTAAAEDQSQLPTAPTTNEGKKWRIAYYEGGPHLEFRKVLTAVIRGLMTQGWIDTAELPTWTGESTAPIWQWLSTEASSDFLEFVDDGYYNSDWVDEKRPHIVAALMPRLGSSRDVDLLIAMGTVAGQAFANDLHSTPTIILATSDPVASGVIPSIEDSGYDHVHATVNPTRFERQVRIFHDAIGFKTLGIMFEDSPNGRSYSGVSSVEKVANERGFSINQCYVLDELVDDIPARNESALSCFEELAAKSDAIYVSQNLGVNATTIPRLVEIAHQHQVPTFSQWDSAEVEQGLLLSLAPAEFKYIGEFHASVIAQVLNGAKPGDVNQVFQDPIKLALNMKTAEIIGFIPTAAVLAATDEMYFEIVNPSDTPQ